MELRDTDSTVTCLLDATVTAQHRCLSFEGFRTRTVVGLSRKVKFDHFHCIFTRLSHIADQVPLYKVVLQNIIN